MKIIGQTLTASIEEVPTLQASIRRTPSTIKADIQTVEIGGGGTENVRVATTEEWNSQPQLIGLRGVVYIYSDHEMTDDGKPIPGFKVGDGLGYLIDAPFNDDLAIQHIADTSIHVTDAEKEFWNNKVTAYIDATNIENLILTKN